MANNIFLRALGLSTSPNRLTNEPGSLIEASNVVIKRDNVIEPRRGFKLFGDSFGNAATRAKQLAVYKSRILRHFESTLQYDNGTTNADGESVFDSFAGSYTEPEAGIRIKYLESPNGNFYFTTNDGIKKISATSNSEFTTENNYITNAGGLKALNSSARLNIEYGDIGDWFVQDSAVAYRILWTIKDINNQSVPGTPSERVEIYNPMLQLMLNDFSVLLKTLDEVSYQSGTRINDANYVSTLLLSNTASASSLRTNLISLAEKLDLEQGTLFSSSDISSASISSGICTVTLAANVGIYGQVSVGDKIYLKGFTPATGTLNGVQTVTAITATTIAFSTTATGAVSLSSESIESGWFRSITEPVIPSTTPTHNDLQSIQDYLEDIIIELQSDHYIRQIYDNDGSATSFPAELTTVTLTGAVGQVDNDAAADARDIVENGDLIYLSGTFSGASPAITGIQTINGTAITATQFAFNSTSTGTVTLGTDSRIDKILRFTPTTKTTFIDGLSITTTTTTFVTLQVPEDATTSHFFQIYRSDLITAIDTDVLSDLVPNDEMKLVYEAYPTQAEIDSGSITIEDIVLDDFRGANLYTNAITGEGILQANDLPPLAKDINLYKNYTFYANTQTRQRFDLDLLGVVDLVSEYNAGRTPKFVISTSDGIESDVYDFVTGLEQITPITFGTAESAGNYNGKYFLLYSANDNTSYYVWYKANGVGTDPAPANKTGILVNISSGDTANTIASKTQNVLTSYIRDFSATVLTSTVTITNIDVGYTTNASNVDVPSLTIGSITSGRGDRAKQETTNVTCVADVAGSLAGKYFLLSTAFDRRQYYVWYSVSGSGSDPLIAGRTAIKVDIVTNDSATNVATATKNELNDLNDNTRFIATSNSSVLTIRNYRFGPSTNISAGTSGFSISVTEPGILQFLLSEAVSPAQAVDETARSMIKIINANNNGLVSGFYLSGAEDVPGQMNFEAKDLSLGSVYFLTNRGTSTIQIGDSFSPTLTPTNSITAISAASTTVITSASHGLSDGNQIMISNSNSTPNIDGVYTITRDISDPTNKFTIPVYVTGSGNQGGWINITNINIAVSDNEERPNRLYYSKIQQPEAVPILNYLDIGPKDKAILRIYPLRDSLMVFKEDGLYRVSGETAPFTVSIFESSCILAAPDSLSISNGSLYGWTTQGISSISESGVNILSRPIDVDILYRSSSQFTNFRTATWGIGYDSDNSYLVFTIEKTSDTIAQIAYVYNNLTNTWTNYDKTNTCGIINPVDDKLYLGAGDINQLEMERKVFDRTDHADREYNRSLQTNGYLNDGLSLTLESVSDIEIGDVLTQEQTLTIYEYNALLKKLDIDSGVADNNYFSVLEAVNGDNLRVKLASASTTVGLAAKLDADLGVSSTDYLSTISTKTGTITGNTIANPTIVTTSSPHGLVSDRIITITGSNSSPSIDGEYVVTVLNSTTFSIPVNVITAGTTGTFTTVDNDFRDLEACYNAIISKLNSDVGVSFTNYSEIDTSTLQEVIINAINVYTKQVTVNAALPFVVGDVTIYKAIKSNYTYAPITFNDPLSLKHIREATMMFQDRLFTNAKLGFSTDLLPAFTNITIPGSNGSIFGHKSFGAGYFGGAGNTAPFRTYIPRNAQRCRLMNIRFEHDTAREKYSVNGVSLVGEFELSSRAYR